MPTDNEIKNHLLREIRIHKTSEFWKAFLKQGLSRYEIGEYMIDNVRAWVAQIEVENASRSEKGEPLIDANKMINECLAETGYFDGSILEGTPYDENLESSYKESDPQKLQNLQVFINNYAKRMYADSTFKGAAAMPRLSPEELEELVKKRLLVSINEFCKNNKFFLTQKEKNLFINHAIKAAQAPAPEAIQKPEKPEKPKTSFSLLSGFKRAIEQKREASKQADARKQAVKAEKQDDASFNQVMDNIQSQLQTKLEEPIGVEPAFSAQEITKIVADFSEINRNDPKLRGAVLEAIKARKTNEPRKIDAAVNEIFNILKIPDEQKQQQLRPIIKDAIMGQPKKKSGLFGKNKI